MSKKYDYFEAMDRTRVICDMIYKLLYDHKGSKVQDIYLLNTATKALEDLYQDFADRFNAECEKDPHET